jgi:ABC-type sulfate/molybdate transport systems ATPase subunit
MKPGLVLERASFRYGELPVLAESDLHVPRGQMVVVTGDNGVGKSTLLYLCAGLVPATSGRVLLDGQLPSVTRPSDMIRHGVRRGFVFQHGGLLANRSALDNVALPLAYHADVLGIDEREAQSKAREILIELRVAQTDLHSLPAHLSVGVRQRVALARALVVRPTFVFMDDPDAGLDESTKQLVFQRLERLRDDPDVTTILTSTDPELIDFLGVDVVRLENGRLMRERRRPQLA